MSIRNRAQDTELIVVQYPRGATALIWLDPASDSIVTNHAGLGSALRRGVRNWEGRPVFPRERHAFLEAAYDHLFLNGYAVRWMRAAAHVDVQRSYRV